MPAVLRAWKIQRALGESFTVREAKWVAALSGLGAGIAEVIMWAGKYAAREQACEALKQPFDTEDLDEDLLMWDWEKVTARLVRGKNPSLSWILGASQPPNQLQFDRETLIALAVGTELGFGMTPPLPIPEELKIRDRPPLDVETTRSFIELLPSEEAVWVYVRWLKHLSRGPRLPHTSIEERVDVIAKLRAWVAGHPWPRICVDFGSAEALIQCRDNLRPTELLERLGLESQEQLAQREAKSSKEASDERPH
jgi:hypothetical protein